MSKYFLSKVPVHALLSRNDINKGKHGWDINSPTFRHRAVMGLFGDIDGSPRKEANILFRLDRVAGQAPYFLIQSTIRPIAQDLITGMEVKEMDFPELAAGQIVSFSVALNAVRRKSIQVDGKRKVKIQPVPEDHDVEALENGETTMTPWLQEKLSSVFDEVRVVNHLRDVLQDSSSKGAMTIQLDSIEGFAQVRDPNALKEVLAKGIGREKAYGCGLLSVRAV